MDFEVTRYSRWSLLGHETIHVELTCHAGEGPHKPPYDTWAVRQGPWCLNAGLEWEYEPLPSSRGDDFLRRTRFTKDEALELAAAYISEHEAIGR
jgi:hypothetical protein